ncbi:MAG: gliding motility-associated C-terminal domain-containing protein [Saprospiraceae bacterium]
MIYVPNAFSPNDDGVNDELGVFPPAGLEGNIAVYQIFDRWGGQVFESRDNLLGSTSGWWNGEYRGQPAQEGVYLYHIEISLLNGRSITLQGDVVVVR